jgi:hypothetical protein
MVGWRTHSGRMDSKKLSSAEANPGPVRPSLPPLVALTSGPAYVKQHPAPEPMMPQSESCWDDMSPFMPTVYRVVVRQA